jgi:hypothetical protein
VGLEGGVREGTIGVGLGLGLGLGLRLRLGLGLRLWAEARAGAGAGHRLRPGLALHAHALAAQGEVGLGHIERHVRCSPLQVGCQGEGGRQRVVQAWGQVEGGWRGLGPGWRSGF